MRDCCIAISAVALCFTTFVRGAAQGSLKEHLISSCGTRPQIIPKACFIPRPKPGERSIIERPCGGPVIDEEPEIVTSVPAEYTQQALDDRYAGHVLVWLTLLDDGTASAYKIRNPVGMGLDEKAIEAVRRFEFRPAKRNDRPVQVFAEVMISFCRPEHASE